MHAQERRKVAVVGARGIGRHHANWWHTEGAEVCAIVGTSVESTSATVETLRGMFAFAGRPYTDLGAMLAAEKPDIVDVCSPNELHRDHTARALEAGCDVLCEKPFFYDTSMPDDAVLGAARDVVELARSSGRLLGMCAQYAAGTRTCANLLGMAPGGAIASAGATIMSPAKGRTFDAEETWIDLGPHLISVVHELVPGAQFAWDRASCEVDGNVAAVRVVATNADGAECSCELTSGHTEGEPANVRRVVVDGTRFDIEGGKDADGNFCAAISYGDDTAQRVDAMRLTIRAFLGGTATVSGETAAANLEALFSGRDLIRRA